MAHRLRRRVSYLLTLIAVALGLNSCKGQPGDSATFDADGTAHISRVVPMPSTISPEAQKWLDSLTHQKYGQQTLAERRAGTDKWRVDQSAVATPGPPRGTRRGALGAHRGHRELDR